MLQQNLAIRTEQDGRIVNRLPRPLRQSRHHVYAGILGRRRKPRARCAWHGVRQLTRRWMGPTRVETFRQHKDVAFLCGRLGNKALRAPKIPRQVAPRDVKLSHSDPHNHRDYLIL